MYDGADPCDESAVKRNLNYRDLIDYKKQNGDCLVAVRNPDGTANSLGRWVSSMRSNYKDKVASLTKKCIELLEHISFVWVVNPHHYNAGDDERNWKAIAAKVVYGVTAYEAMRLSGYSQDEATNDNNKKNLNNKIVELINNQKLKNLDRIMSIILTVRQNHSSTDTDVVGLVYGDENEFADLLRNEGKLVVQDESESDDSSDEGTGQPQPAPPARKKQRTDGNYSKNAALPPPQRPSLPLASRNHAGTTTNTETAASTNATNQHKNNFRSAWL